MARLLSLDKFTQLPAHEAYPGHHVMCTLTEQALVHGRGWVEFGVSPTFSPSSVIAEGGAEWAAQSLLWADQARQAAFQSTLAARAGLNLTQSAVERWARVARLTDPLDEVGRVHVDIARRLVDGNATAAEARDEMRRRGLRSEESWPNVAFFESLGAYIVSYSYGKRLVDGWVRAQPEPPWAAFAAFARRPVLPRHMPYHTPV